MALFVELCVLLKFTSIYIVDADGSPVWEGKAESEPTSLIKALHCRGRGERSVRFPVLCSHQARAVSLDDLASPNPIVERIYGSSPDRSADQAE